MKLIEFVTDPSSNQYSMSRLCMGVLILVFIPVYFYLKAIKVDVDHRVIIACVASVASVYGLNSLSGPIAKVINKIKPGTASTTDSDTYKGEV
jgi:hypothetical protein